MQDNYVVYIHIFPNNKVYIGMTQQNPKRRWRGGAGYSGQLRLKAAIDKYGWKNIQHKLLKENLTMADAEYYEQYYIAKYNSDNPVYGYNNSIGGISSTRYNMTTRKKISDARKGIQFSKTHKQNLSKALNKYFNDDYELNKESIAKMKYNDMVNSPKRKEVICIETQQIYLSVRDAGRQTGINYRTIGEVCNKKYGRKTAGGYHWEFYERGGV